MCLLVEHVHRSHDEESSCGEYNRLGLALLVSCMDVLYNILNLFFKALKALSIVTLSDECLRLKSSFGLCGFLPPIFTQVVPCGTVRG
jgi:hypothetical protein